MRIAAAIFSMVALIVCWTISQPAVAINAAQPQYCQGQATTSTPINNAGSSTSLKLISKVSSKKVYVCAINIGPVAGAVNVALVEGTKTTTECDTSTAGMAGGTTAATGWQFAANGGLTMGDGVGQIAKTANANFDVCLLFSTGVQVSGVITWAQF